MEPFQTLPIAASFIAERILAPYADGFKLVRLVSCQLRHASGAH